jgi:hypothetical protein
VIAITSPRVGEGDIVADTVQDSQSCVSQLQSFPQTSFRNLHCRSRFAVFLLLKSSRLQPPSIPWRFRALLIAENACFDVVLAPVARHSSRFLTILSNDTSVAAQADVLSSNVLIAGFPA